MGGNPQAGNRPRDESALSLGNRPHGRFGFRILTALWRKKRTRLTREFGTHDASVRCHENRSTAGVQRRHVSRSLRVRRTLEDGLPSFFSGEVSPEHPPSKRGGERGDRHRDFRRRPNVGRGAARGREPWEPGGERERRGRGARRHDADRRAGPSARAHRERWRD